MKSSIRSHNKLPPIQQDFSERNMFILSIRSKRKPLSSNKAQFKSVLQQYQVEQQNQRFQEPPKIVYFPVQQYKDFLKGQRIYLQIYFQDKTILSGYEPYIQIMGGKVQKRITPNTTVILVSQMKLQKYNKLKERVSRICQKTTPKILSFLWIEQIYKQKRKVQKQLFIFDQKIDIIDPVEEQEQLMPDYFHRQKIRGDFLNQMLEFIEQQKDQGITKIFDKRHKNQQRSGTLTINPGVKMRIIQTQQEEKDLAYLKTIRPYNYFMPPFDKKKNNKKKVQNTSDYNFVMPKKRKNNRQTQKINADKKLADQIKEQQKEKMNQSLSKSSSIKQTQSEFKSRMRRQHGSQRVDINKLLNKYLPKNQNILNTNDNRSKSTSKKSSRKQDQLKISMKQKSKQRFFGSANFSKKVQSKNRHNIQLEQQIYQQQRSVQNDQYYQQNYFQKDFYGSYQQDQFQNQNYDFSNTQKSKHSITNRNGLHNSKQHITKSKRKKSDEVFMVQNMKATNVNKQVSNDIQLNYQYQDALLEIQNTLSKNYTRKSTSQLGSVKEMKQCKAYPEKLDRTMTVTKYKQKSELREYCMKRIIEFYEKIKFRFTNISRLNQVAQINLSSNFNYNEQCEPIVYNVIANESQILKLINQFNNKILTKVDKPNAIHFNLIDFQQFHNQLQNYKVVQMFLRFNYQNSINNQHQQFKNNQNLCLQLSTQNIQIQLPDYKTVSLNLFQQVILQISKSQLPNLLQIRYICNVKSKEDILLAYSCLIQKKKIIDGRVLKQLFNIVTLFNASQKIPYETQSNKQSSKSLSVYNNSNGNHQSISSFNKIYKDDIKNELDEKIKYKLSNSFTNAIMNMTQIKNKKILCFLSNKQIQNKVKLICRIFGGVFVSPSYNGEVDVTIFDRRQFSKSKKPQNLQYSELIQSLIIL